MGWPPRAASSANLRLHMRLLRRRNVFGRFRRARRHHIRIAAMTIGAANDHRRIRMHRGAVRRRVTAHAAGALLLRLLRRFSSRNRTDGAWAQPPRPHARSSGCRNSPEAGQPQSSASTVSQTGQRIPAHRFQNSVAAKLPGLIADPQSSTLSAVCLDANQSNQN